MPDPFPLWSAVAVVKHHRFKRNTGYGFSSIITGKPVMIEQEGLSLTVSCPSRASRFPLRQPVVAESGPEPLSITSYWLLHEAAVCCRTVHRSKDCLLTTVAIHVD